MKKITLLVSERDREEFVSDLRDAGVVHVRHASAPEAHEIKFIEDRISAVEKMIEELQPYTDAEKGARETYPREGEREIHDDADMIKSIANERLEILKNISGLEKQIDWFKCWGEFDPRDLKAIGEKGAVIRFYELTRQQYNRIEDKKGYYLISGGKKNVCMAVITWQEDEGLPYEEIIPPLKSSGELNEEASILRKRTEEIENIMKEKAGALDLIKECKNELEKEHDFITVKFGMKEEGKFSYLKGYAPVNALKKIIAMAKKKGLGYLIEEPDDPDDTPTLITNPRWIRIVDPIFKFMNTLPGYKEFDVSFIFLIFFSLFFAMLIGDAGYGILFLIITFLVRCKSKHLPGEPFFLMYLLSVATICWGAVTGTWFGAEKIAQIPFLNMLVIDSIDSFAGNNQNLLIYYCFIIGAVHLTIAHLFRAVRVINSILSLAEFGWIMILWCMFFAAGKFVLGNPFPPFALWMFDAGIILVLFFSKPEKGIIKGALATLANLPLSIISSFSDVVSYLRLFAVGYASVVVAASFNSMAIGDGIKGVVGGIMAVLILLLGHVLNIVLGFMAVVVHGIRLNMLEFSGHIGMQWSGERYKPFSK